MAIVTNIALLERSRKLTKAQILALTFQIAKAVKVMTDPLHYSWSVQEN
jgi:hypothetical protein